MPEFLLEQLPSPIQLRAQLEAMVRRDLLGPAGGPEEEVDERAVRGRYILSLLAPRVLGHGFHETAQGVRFQISEAARREVLGRLLELTHQRYAEEVASRGH
jgi:hypothetical protein